MFKNSLYLPLLLLPTRMHGSRAFISEEFGEEEKYKAWFTFIAICHINLVIQTDSQNGGEGCEEQRHKNYIIAPSNIVYCTIKKLATSTS